MSFYSDSAPLNGRLGLMTWGFCIFFLFVTVLVFSCNGGSSSNADATATPTSAAQTTNTPTPTPSTGTPTATPTSDSRSLVQPEDIEYIGAFLLPAGDGTQGWDTWAYSGEALTFNPNGDPGGASDGYGGSLFGTGFDVYSYVSEITIPAPVNSKNYSALNRATTLQGFSDIRGGLFDALVEMPRVALLYTPGTSALEAKLQMAWSQHLLDESTTIASHAWCDPVLSQPNTQGAWWIGDASPYSTAGYLFSIPQQWADTYTGGRSLATGRFRDGGLSGMGPALYAYAPWLEGNPPANGTHLQAVTLLKYPEFTGENIHDPHMNDYHSADEWEGGAWISLGDKKAVLFIGNKGEGYCWYGYYSPNGDGMPCVQTDGADIMCYTPDFDFCPPELTGECEGHDEASRGWWSSTYSAMILFYNPDDFVAVARGEMAPYQPQPYATLNLDQWLFLNHSTDFSSLGYGDQRRYRLGETAFDRDNNLLYILERFAEVTQPVVHVFHVRN